MSIRRTVAAVVLSIAIVAGSGGVVSADTIERLKQKKSETDLQIQENKEKASALQTRQSKLYKELEVLDNEINSAQAEITALETQIEELILVIEQTQGEIDSAKQQIEENTESFLNRLQVMYINGDVGFMEVMFSSTDINDFLSRSTMMKCVAEYDRRLIEEMKNDKTDLEAKELELKGQKTSLEVAKSSLEKKKADLENSQRSKNQLLNQVIDDQESVEITLSELKNTSNAISKEIAEKIATAERLERERKEREAKEARERAAREASTKKKSSSKSSASSNTSKVVKTSRLSEGGLVWPVPSSYRITSRFGSRIHPISKRPSFHGGLDIGAGHGSSIVAVKGGTVISASYRGGYGNCIMVSHGDGLVSLYAHCSSFNASVGSTVSAGQVIAYIGSTGNSTGPHLHLEIRQSGVKKNPLNYL